MVNLKTPFLFWLKSPEMLHTIVETNRKYTLPYVQCLNPLEALHLRHQELRHKFETTGISHPGESLQWIECLSRTYDLWGDSVRNCPADTKVLFFHLSLYSDGFGLSGIIGVLCTNQSLEH